MVRGEASLILSEVALVLDDLSDLAHQNVEKVHHRAVNTGRGTLGRIRLEGASGFFTFLCDKAHLVERAHSDWRITPVKKNSGLKGDLLLGHYLRDEDGEWHASNYMIGKSTFDHHVIDDRWDVQTLVIEYGINDIGHLDGKLTLVSGREQIVGEDAL